jgi:flavorubredoxin
MKLVTQRLSLDQPYVRESIPKRALVIFDTRFGNTEKIARAFDSGLKQVGVETSCLKTSDVDLASLKEFGLIAIGAPTEWLTASKPMKAFLVNLKKAEMNGRFGFAFDTRLGRALSGSAGKLIEKELQRDGVRLLRPHESAIVFGKNSSMDKHLINYGDGYQW